MSRIGGMIGAAATLSLMWVGSAGNAAAPPALHALVDKYCVTCHDNTDNIPAGRPLYLDEADLDDPAKNADTWELVIRKLRLRAMPPQGKPRPNPEALHNLSDYLVTKLDQSAHQKPDAGDFPLHRLNRLEYANAVRDIFGIDIDVSRLLPPDTADHGFDNVATGLVVTPALLDRYLVAAVRIAESAVGNKDAEAELTVFPLDLDGDQTGYVEGLPLGTRAGTRVRFNFPVDGLYQFRAELPHPADNADLGNEGQEMQHEYEILVDGVRVHSALLGGAASQAASFISMAVNNARVQEDLTTRAFVTAGVHDVTFTFVDRSGISEDLYPPPVRNSQDVESGAGRPRLLLTSISGPLERKGISTTMPSRRRLYVCAPTTADIERQCANQILSRVARLAYRRPVTTDDMSAIMNFYDAGRQHGDFDAGIRSALPRILTSLSFLYRIEQDPAGPGNAGSHSISDLELASRLSFFLWSSIPDESLLALAASGKLHNEQVLKQQVVRMLADSRSAALSTNFPDQWFELRSLEKFSADLLPFQKWNTDLRRDLQTETHLLFGSLLHENRSALDLLTADYTFLNERVANLYGISGIHGEAFRRVSLTDPNRRGILGEGSILAVTSATTRTSPVFRGKWITTNILDTPPLPPPPDVPALAANDSVSAPRTMRERLEEHRKNSVCASCHKNMDPIGFALENFDAIGQWRSKSEAGTPIDASGVLSDGTRIDGPVELRNALIRDPEIFVTTFTERLMTYALGRGLRPNDMPVVRQIVRNSASGGYRMQSIVQGIVASVPFRMRNPSSAQPDAGPLATKTAAR
jgi:mono/diheme cytochrome c family protein